MKFLMTFLVALVAFEHLYFMILEMFFWTKPKGLKVFGLTMEKAESSKVLAANQGLYNGFLAVGLLWGLLNEKSDVVLYFLVCVVIAGIYGSFSTKNIRLFYVQALPALLALAIALLI